MAGPGPPFVCFAALFSSPCSATASGVAVAGGVGDEGLSGWAICAHTHSTVTGEAGRPRGPHCSEPRDRLVPQQRLAWSNFALGACAWTVVEDLQGMCPFGPPRVSLSIIQKPFVSSKT